MAGHNQCDISDGEGKGERIKTTRATKWPAGQVPSRRSIRGITEPDEFTVDDDEPARHLDITNRNPPDRQTAIGRCDRRRHSDRYVIVRRLEDADREGKFSVVDFPLCADASEITHRLGMIQSAKTPTQLTNLVDARQGAKK